MAASEVSIDQSIEQVNENEDLDKYFKGFV